MKMFNCSIIRKVQKVFYLIKLADPGRLIINGKFWRISEMFSLPTAYKAIPYNTNLRANPRHHGDRDPEHTHTHARTHARTHAHTHTHTHTHTLIPQQTKQSVPPPKRENHIARNNTNYITDLRPKSTP